MYCAVTIRDRMSGRPAFRRIYPQPKRAVSFKRFARSQARVYATYASARNTSRSGSIICNSRVELMRNIDEYKRDVIGEERLSQVCGTSRYAADFLQRQRKNRSLGRERFFFYLLQDFYLFKTIATDCPAIVSAN